MVFFRINSRKSVFSGLAQCMRQGNDFFFHKKLTFFFEILQALLFFPALADGTPGRDSEKYSPSEIMYSLRRCLRHIHYTYSQGIWQYTSLYIVTVYSAVYFYCFLYCCFAPYSLYIFTVVNMGIYCQVYILLQCFRHIHYIHSYGEEEDTYTYSLY